MPLRLLMVCLFGILVSYCSLIYSEMHPYVDYMYNVRILEKYDDYNFRADVADRYDVRHEFGLTFCPDYQVTTEMQPGVTLDYLAYIRDVHLKCFEVGKPQYGYGLHRRNNVPIVDSSFARQTTTQGTTQTP